MIKRIIENEIGERLEVVVVSGLVGISAEIGFSTYEFLFDNDEDVHCFISELQRAMIVAKEEPKEDDSNEDDMELVYDFPSNKRAWTIGEIADMVAERAKEKLDELLSGKVEHCSNDSNDKEEKKEESSENSERDKNKFVDPREKFYCKKGTCTEAEQCNFCWNIQHPFNQVMELCNCGKPMSTHRCTSTGCNNSNFFGPGTVDTTSNGTSNDK